MRQKPGIKRNHGEKFVNDIGWATYNQCSAEKRIRIVLDGLKGEGATLTPKGSPTDFRRRRTDQSRHA